MLQFRNYERNTSAILILISFEIKMCLGKSTVEFHRFINFFSTLEKLQKRSTPCLKKTYEYYL